MSLGSLRKHKSPFRWYDLKPGEELKLKDFGVGETAMSRRKLYFPTCDPDRIPNPQSPIPI